MESQRPKVNQPSPSSPCMFGAGSAIFKTLVQLLYDYPRQSLCLDRKTRQVQPWKECWRGAERRTSFSCLPALWGDTYNHLQGCSWDPRPVTGHWIPSPPPLEPASSRAWNCPGEKGAACQVSAHLGPQPGPRPGQTLQSVHSLKQSGQKGVLESTLPCLLLCSSRNNRK